MCFEAPEISSLDIWVMATGSECFTDMFTSCALNVLYSRSHNVHCRA